MEPIPDSWPPDLESPLTGARVPMFPLPALFLFPGQILPLHIFEPRYRQMIEDSLDGPGRLVIATILEREDDSADSPDVLGIAGLGEIIRHERLKDGRFMVWLCGLARVVIEEVDSDRLYRRVRCETLAEISESGEDESRLQPPLVEAIHARTGLTVGSPEEVSTTQLADVLAQCLRVPQRLMEQIYCESHVAIRAQKLLAAHRAYPVQG